MNKKEKEIYFEAIRVADLLEKQVSYLKLESDGKSESIGQLKNNFRDLEESYNKRNREIVDSRNSEKDAKDELLIWKEKYKIVRDIMLRAIWRVDE